MQLCEQILGRIIKTIVMRRRTNAMYPSLDLGDFSLLVAFLGGYTISPHQDQGLPGGLWGLFKLSLGYFPSITLPPGSLPTPGLVLS